MSLSGLLSWGVGATIGGWGGWWLGSQIGMTTAFILSVVGTAAGVYYGRKLAQHLGV